MSPATQQHLIILIVVAYLLGSIPFGLLVGLSKGIDVRKAGSGNIGSTNVGRLLGKRFFFLVFFLELLKGLIPMVLAGFVAINTEPSTKLYILWLTVGLAALFGHVFSIFLRFKGGKGVATGLGIMLGLWPYCTLPGLIGLAVFLIVLGLFKYVSLASMIGAITFPFSYFLLGTFWGWDPLGKQLPLLIFTSVLAVLVVVRHRSNIARLRAGTESRIGRKPTLVPSPGTPGEG